MTDADQRLLDEQAYFDLIDELADDPRLFAQTFGQGWPARAARVPSLRAAHLPGPGERFPSFSARPVHPLTRGCADCHPGEAAAARVDGRRLCQNCLHPED